MFSKEEIYMKTFWSRVTFVLATVAVAVASTCCFPYSFSQFLIQSFWSLSPESENIHLALAVDPLMHDSTIQNEFASRLVEVGATSVGLLDKGTVSWIHGKPNIPPSLLSCPFNKETLEVNDNCIVALNAGFKLIISKDLLTLPILASYGTDKTIILTTNSHPSRQTHVLASVLSGRAIPILPSKILLPCVVLASFVFYVLFRFFRSYMQIVLLWLLVSSFSLFVSLSYHLPLIPVEVVILAAIPTFVWHVLRSLVRLNRLEATIKELLPFTSEDGHTEDSVNEKLSNLLSIHRALSSVERKVRRLFAGSRISLYTVSGDRLGRISGVAYYRNRPESMNLLKMSTKERRKVLAERDISILESLSSDLSTTLFVPIPLNGSLVGGYSVHIPLPRERVIPQAGLLRCFVPQGRNILRKEVRQCGQKSPELVIEHVRSELATQLSFFQALPVPCARFNLMTAEGKANEALVSLSGIPAQWIGTKPITDMLGRVMLLSPIELGETLGQVLNGFKKALILAKPLGNNRLLLITPIFDSAPEPVGVFLTFLPRDSESVDQAEISDLEKSWKQEALRSF
jgi:hypothetical protein